MAIFAIALWHGKGLAQEQAAMGSGAFVIFAVCEILYLLLLRYRLTEMFKTINWKILAVEYTFMFLLMSIAVSVAFGFEATNKKESFGDAFVWGSFIGLIVYGVKNLQMFALVPEWNIHYLFLDTLKGILVTSTSAVVAIAIFIKRDFFFTFELF